MAWLLVFPLSLMAGPAGLAVALVAFLGWSKRDRNRTDRRPVPKRPLFDWRKATPVTQEFVDYFNS